MKNCMKNPELYAIVPIEPTEEMLDSGAKTFLTEYDQPFKA